MLQRGLRPRMRLVRLLQTRMKSGQRTAIARRCRAAVAHACHAIGAGCGWLRRLANAPHHPEGRHKLLEDECPMLWQHGARWTLAFGPVTFSAGQTATAG